MDASIRNSTDMSLLNTQRLFHNASHVLQTYQSMVMNNLTFWFQKQIILKFFFISLLKNDTDL